jgi:uncharacterized protein YbjT (DUF2867 family)
MTILVTGATGTIGHHVVDQLAQRGHPVRALTRDATRARLPAGVELVEGDLTRPDTLGPALQDASALHLIAMAGDDYRPLARAPEIVAAAVEAGVKHITVLTGTDDELAVVRAVESSGVDWTHVRPLEFMANKLGWADSIRSEGVVRSGFGGHVSALVDEADVAAVIVAALTEDGHGGKTYTPTGPEALSRFDAARIIGEVIGRPVRFHELTEAEVREQMRGMGVQPDVIDFVVGYEASPPPEASLVTSTVEYVTGRPSRDLASWVAAHADAFLP